MNTWQIFLLLLFLIFTEFIFNLPTAYQLVLVKNCGELISISSSHWVKTRVHLGQVTSPSQGHIKMNETTIAHSHQKEIRSPVNLTCMFSPCINHACVGVFKGTTHPGFEPLTFLLCLFTCVSVCNECNWRLLWFNKTFKKSTFDEQLKLYIFF